MSWKDNVDRSFQTIQEMLIDRKILNDTELEILQSLSKNELASFTKQQQVFNIDIGNAVRIIYYLQPFKMPDFKTYIEDTDFDLYIVIYKKLTTNNIKGIQEFQSKLEKPITMQFFKIEEVLFNLTKHILVPKHEVITDDTEIENICKANNIKNRHHLPLLRETDAVAKYYGMKPGNVAKITRVSPSAGEYTVYRCCV